LGLGIFSCAHFKECESKIKNEFHNFVEFNLNNRNASIPVQDLENVTWEYSTIFAPKTNIKPEMFTSMFVEKEQGEEVKERRKNLRE
jgi:hypothetical protein